MARNILIFSDGTGQVGGYAFDEDRAKTNGVPRATRASATGEVAQPKQVPAHDPNPLAKRTRIVLSEQKN